MRCLENSSGILLALINSWSKELLKELCAIIVISFIPKSNAMDFFLSFLLLTIFYSVVYFYIAYAFFNFHLAHALSELVGFHHAVSSSFHHYVIGISESIFRSSSPPCSLTSMKLVSTKLEYRLCKLGGLVWLPFLLLY